MSLTCILLSLMSAQKMDAIQALQSCGPRRCLVATRWLPAATPTSHLPSTPLGTWRWTDGLNGKCIFRHLSREKVGHNLTYLQEEKLYLAAVCCWPAKVARSADRTLASVQKPSGLLKASTGNDEWMAKSIEYRYLTWWLVPRYRLELQ